MRRRALEKIKSIIRRFGVDIVGFPKAGYDEEDLPEDLHPFTKEIFKAVKPYTMTCIERVDALINAVQYIVENNIEGAMVECGVWRGGSIMTMALTLKKLGIENKEIYLYDTFSGMTEPAEVDVAVDGETAKQIFSQKKISQDQSDWCFSSLEEVKDNIFSTGYPKELFHFVKGKVENTIPQAIPDKISLLRLDTDWYESTKHEMEHLFPILEKKGVLIIDDYGYWKGSRKAIDDYIEKKKICIFFNKTDNFGARIAIKS